MNAQESHAACTHHAKTRHSPNGIDFIDVCLTCLKAWQIRGITGEVQALSQWYVNDAIKLEMNQYDGILLQDTEQVDRAFNDACYALRARAEREPHQQFYLYYRSSSPTRAGRLQFGTDNPNPEEYELAAVLPRSAPISTESLRARFRPLVWKLPIMHYEEKGS